MTEKNLNNKYSPKSKHKRILLQEEKSSLHPDKKGNLFTKGDSLNDNLIKQQPKRYLPHKLSFAIISALTIGLISGFTMLYLLTGKEDSAADSIEKNIKTEHTATSTDSNTEDPLVTYEFPSLQAFTLQIGVFSEKANAEQFIEWLDDKTFLPIIWPDDSLFYVFVGLASTQEQAENLKEKVSSLEAEAFIKEWQTESFTKQVTTEEQQWLESFNALWESSLKDKKDIKNIKLNWQQLLTEIPEQSSLLTPMVEHIEAFIKSDGENPLQIDQFLILVWQAHTNLQNSS